MWSYSSWFYPAHLRQKYSQFLNVMRSRSQLYRRTFFPWWVDSPKHIAQKCCLELWQPVILDRARWKRHFWSWMTVIIFFLVFWICEDWFSPLISISSLLRAMIELQEILTIFQACFFYDDPDSNSNNNNCIALFITSTQEIMFNSSLLLKVLFYYSYNIIFSECSSKIFNNIIHMAGLL